MKCRIGEPHFLSVQGEGNRTGVLSVFMRVNGCNLSCKGFFQKEPTNPETYIDPIQGIDPKSIKRLEDFPVVKYGCDTLYAIDPRFKHLTTDYESVAALVDDLAALLPSGQWKHPLTGNEIDFCITGGEPLLQQKLIIEIDKEFAKRWDSKGPSIIQIETNGTTALTPAFETHFNSTPLRDINWNVSPKLYNVTGEKDAWFPKIVASYFHQSPLGCLKFVVNGKDESWKELEQKVRELREEGLGHIPIYVMPCGATSTQQNDIEYIKPIAERAIAEGYHISGRSHVIMFGNGIGT